MQFVEEMVAQQETFGDAAFETATARLLDAADPLEMLTLRRVERETYRELRRIRDDVPVILSSGYNEQEVTSRFVGKGLAGFIQKPYRLVELEAKIREVLRKR